MKKNIFLKFFVLLFIPFSLACNDSAIQTKVGLETTDSTSSSRLDSNKKSASLKPGFDTTDSPSNLNNNDCKCYANGEAFEAGGTACLGGWQAVCIDRDGSCGWDYPEYEGKKQPCTD